MGKLLHCSLKFGPTVTGDFIRLCFRDIYWIESDSRLMKAGPNDREPQQIARLPFKASRSNPLLLHRENIYVINDENKGMFRVPIGSKNQVYETPLSDSNIQQVLPQMMLFIIIVTSDITARKYSPRTL